MFPPEAFFLTLMKLVRILQMQEIRFHLTGGLVTVYYSEPRLTIDADK